MLKIYDLVKASAIGAYYTEATENAIPYLGTAFFPDRKQAGLELSWLKGKGGLPVALKPSNFDAKATLRDRIGFSEISTEMPFFREAMKIKEKDRQKIMALEASDLKYVQPYIDRIFDDVKQLVDGATVQAERMRMQLLATGGIDIKANGLAYTYDYDQKGEFAKNNMETLTGTDKWSDLANSNPVEDIREVQDKVEQETGSRPTRAIMTRKTYNYLLNNAKIKTAINGATNAVIAISEAQLNNYLSQTLRITCVIYTKKYKDESGVTKNFYPDDQITLLPDGTLGNTWYGTTPEEADLMGGNTEASVSIVNTGVAVTTYKEVHPVNVNTVVSEIVVPSFERMDEIFIMKVA